MCGFCPRPVISDQRNCAGLSLVNIAVIVIATLVFVGVLGYGAYRWKIRQEMRDEVKSILKQYMPLAEGEEQAQAGAPKEQPTQQV